MIIYPCFHYLQSQQTVGILCNHFYTYLIVVLNPIQDVKISAANEVRNSISITPIVNHLENATLTTEQGHRNSTSITSITAAPSQPEVIPIEQSIEFSVSNKLQRESNNKVKAKKQKEKKLQRNTSVSKEIQRANEKADHCDKQTVPNARKKRKQIDTTQKDPEIIGKGEDKCSYDVPQKQSKLVNHLTSVSENSDIKNNSVLRSIEKILETSHSNQNVLQESIKLLPDPGRNSNASSQNNVSTSTPTELPNDLLESLDIPQNENSTGCLSPTAAFLMSFPVVSSGTNRTNEHDSLHQLSPSESGILDLDGKNGMNSNDQQLLDNISSLLSVPLVTKTISKVTDIITDYAGNESCTNVLATPSQSEKSGAVMLNNELATKSVDDKLNGSSIGKGSMPSHILGNLLPTITALPAEKPRDYFEPFQTFDEILESLKSSPSKPLVKAAKAPSITNSISNKKSEIPNFSFSSNIRPSIQSELKKRVTTAPTETSALYSKPYGFYETLSSIKPVAIASNPSNMTSAISSTSSNSHASFNYSIPKLVSTNASSGTFSCSNSVYSTPQTSSLAKNTTHSAQGGVVKTTKATSQCNPFNIDQIGLSSGSKSTSSSFVFPPPIISFSSENTYNPYSFDPLASKNPNSISTNLTQPLPPFRNIPFTQLQHNEIQSTATSTYSVSSVVTNSKHLPISTEIKPSVKQIPLPNFNFDTTFSKPSIVAKDCKIPQNNLLKPFNNGPEANNQGSVNNYASVSQKNLDNLRKNRTAATMGNSSNTQKPHVNWMTSVDNQKRSTDHMTLNFTSANTFTSNTYTPISQTPFPLLEDNVPWSPNRLLDSNHFTSVPVLPTLHGDLALNTIGGDNANASSVPNFNLNPKHSLAAPSLQTPTKVLQPSSGYFVQKSNIDRTNQFNALPIETNNSNNTNQSNFFSVSQLVDDTRDQKRNKQANRRLSYSHKSTSGSGNEDRPSNQVNNIDGFVVPHSAQTQATVQSSNLQFQPQSQLMPSTSFNDTYSIPMLTSEPTKLPSQQPSSNYSAEALISTPIIAHQINSSAKKKSTFAASNSLSQEFYNPSESIIDFSSSNDIYNPYFTHNNLPPSDTGYSNFMPGYSDLNLAHPPLMQETQTNYEPQTISVSVNQSINAVNQSFPQVQSNSITNYHASQFSAPSKESEKDPKKQGITNYSISNLTFESSANNMFTAPLSLGSPLLAVPPTTPLMFPSTRSVSDVPGNTSAYHLPNFLPNTSNNYPSYNRNTSSDNFNVNATAQKSAAQNQLSTQPNNSYHLSFPRNQAVVSNNNQSAALLNNSIGSNTNSLTNFNLSAICPEINKDKNWST